MSATLHEFILANRDQIIDRARRRVLNRSAPKSSEETLQSGIPLFLTQLVEALAPLPSPPGLHLVGAQDSHQKISDTAALHGHDLLRHGFTIAQVVHGYGDVCQIVTALASETNAPISSQDFHLFNKLLDDAIAGAVTAYGHQREKDLAYAGTERLGILAHELRNLLNTAILSFDVIKKGTVGVGGSTGAIHSRSLAGLRALVERSLAEVRLETDVPTLERVSVLEFMEEIEVSAAMQAEGYGLQLTVTSVESDVAIDADRQLLASALSNLLQNAFKFTKAHGTVSLTARATADRVLIEVRDECGGLPPGKAEELFRPFRRGISARDGLGLGLGLGLGIALSAVRANAGDIYVRDMPGKGCVFTIDLPRQPPPSTSMLPDGEHGSANDSGKGSDREPKTKARAR